MTKIKGLKMGHLQLTSMMNSHIPSERQAQNILSALNSTVDAALSKLSNASIAYSCLRYLCLWKRAISDSQSQRSKFPQDGESSDACLMYEIEKNPCTKVNKAQTDLDKARQEVILAETHKDVVMNHLSTYSASNGSIKSITDNLQQQIKQLHKELKAVPKPVPHAAATIIRTGQLTQKENEENWMYFSFDSESSLISVDSNSTAYQAALSFPVGEDLWSVPGGTSDSQASQHFAKKMSQADVSITGKFLRVTINRNWFQPSIFKLGNIPLVSFK